MVPMNEVPEIQIQYRPRKVVNGLSPKSMRMYFEDIFSNFLPNNSA